MFILRVPWSFGWASLWGEGGPIASQFEQILKIGLVAHIFLDRRIGWTLSLRPLLWDPKAQTHKAAPFGARKTGSAQNHHHQRYTELGTKGVARSRRPGSETTIEHRTS